MFNKIVLFGEYLLRLTPPANRKIMQAENLEMHWAGSEANIAVSLCLLGEQATYVTALPRSDLAAVGIAQLKKYGVNTTIIQKPNSRTGIYYYENGHGVRPGKVIYDRNHSAFSMLNPGDIEWSSIFQDAAWFHWSGITPALNATVINVYLEALQVAKQRGLMISADFNYRSTLWQYGNSSGDVMPGLLSHCDVILADVDAAKLYFGIEPDENNLVESTCRLLKQKLPDVRYIAMTMRKQFSAVANGYTGYLWHEHHLTASREYRLDGIIERIGAGDAFMAGLILGLINGKPMQEVIDFATACGVMKHSIIGDINIATREEIDTVIHQNGSGRIIR